MVVAHSFCQLKKCTNHYYNIYFFIAENSNEEYNDVTGNAYYINNASVAIENYCLSMAVKEGPVFARSKDTQFQCNTIKKTAPDQLIITETFAANNIQTVYEKKAQFLLDKPGVIGVDINYKPQPSIMIFVNKNECTAELPTELDGFPVRVVKGKAYFA